jgi:uncharacterized membrane protein
MADIDLSKVGPLQILAVDFDEPAFSGKINDELQKLRDQKFIRIVDGVAVQKDASGNVIILEESDLSSEENEKYGAIIGGLIGLGSGDAEVAQLSSEYVAERFNERYEYGLDKEDLEDLTENIPAGDAVLVLLIEHVWAIPFRNAVRDAGGLLLAQDFLSPELLISVGEEVLQQ